MHQAATSSDQISDLLSTKRNTTWAARIARIATTRILAIDSDSASRNARTRLTRDHPGVTDTLLLGPTTSTFSAQRHQCLDHGRIDVLPERLPQLLGWLLPQRHLAPGRRVNLHALGLQLLDEAALRSMIHCVCLVCRLLRRSHEVALDIGSERVPCSLVQHLELNCEDRTHRCCKFEDLEHVEAIGPNRLHMNAIHHPI